MAPLKAKPKPVARRGAAASGSASSSSNTTAPLENVIDSPAPGADASSATERVQNTPIALPAGRLDSLSSPRASSTSARGTTVPLIKYKPKNPGRRTQEERENLNAKFQHADTPTIRPRGGRPSRGTRGGRGGRGGFEGRHVYNPATASGPFALGSVSSGAPKSKIAVERGTDREKYKEFSRSGVKRGAWARTKVEHEGKDSHTLRYTSSDDSDGPRMDVEFISLLDEPNSEDEGGKTEMGGGSSHWGAGAPVRVPRNEHIDRTAIINTDTSLKKAELGAKIKSESQLEDAVGVKEEPADDIIMAECPSPENLKEIKGSASSPAMKKKEVKTPTKRRRSSSSKTKSLLLSLEEKEELERDENDRLMTLEELKGSFSDIKLDKDTDFDMDDVRQDSGNSETDDQILFFQFPAILPQLSVPPIKEEKKGEPPSAPVETDPEITKWPNNEPSTSNPSDLTPKGPLSNYAPPEAEIPPPPFPGQGLKAQQDLLEGFPPPGLAGKLRVHRSGRMTILWGNPTDGDEPFELEVSRGTECMFLQEAVVVKEVSHWGTEDVDEKGARKGAAFSLGQVKGRYVVAPNFDDLVRSGQRWRGGGMAKEPELVGL